MKPEIANFGESDIVKQEDRGVNHKPEAQINRYSTIDDEEIQYAFNLKYFIGIWIEARMQFGDDLRIMNI